jgi:hypothetical protein
MRTANRVVVIILLLGTGAVGLYSGATEIGSVMTTLQRSVSIAVILYGVCGLAGAIALALRRPVAVPLAIGWSAGTIYAATVSSFAFSDPTFSKDGTMTGVSMAALGTMAIAAWVVWATRRATRPSSLPPVAGGGDIPTP